MKNKYWLKEKNTDRLIGTHIDRYRYREITVEGYFTSCYFTSAPTHFLYSFLTQSASDTDSISHVKTSNCYL